jgi:transcriptional regulator with XRE-family HTH domain
MTKEAFEAWLRDNDLTLETAGELLGMTTSAISKYKNGVNPIPLVVELAIEALETRWLDPENQPETRSNKWPKSWRRKAKPSAARRP